MLVFNADVSGNITPTDCIPSVKTNGTYMEYLGIIMRINQIRAVYHDMEEEEVEVIPANIDFATHGDYLLYFNNSTNYHILTYNGSIIADDTNINIIILNSIVGKVKHS